MSKAIAKTSVAGQAAGRPRHFSDVVPRPDNFQSPRSTSPRQRFTRKRTLVAVGAIILLLGISGVTVFVKTRPVPSGADQVQQVMAQVGRHFLLPTNEKPALATVEDQTQLSTPFLKQAKNGDKVLIYAKAKLAIIYRPSVDRIVAVGPVVFDSNTSATNTN